MKTGTTLSPEVGQNGHFSGKWYKEAVPCGTANNRVIRLQGEHRSHTGADGIPINTGDCFFSFI